MPNRLQKSDLPTTQWSLLARLKDKDEGKAGAALEEICRIYHYPLYCQIRRQGLSHHDAEDALQGFFAKLLRLDTFGVADPDKGRLRTFLLVALRRYLASWHRDARRGQVVVASHELLESIAEAERRYTADKSAHEDSPDLLYDRQWASELMADVLQRLRERYKSKGRDRVFEALCPGLLNGGSLIGMKTNELACVLNTTPGALRTSFRRLLEDYRETLESCILDTVENRDLAKQEYDDFLRMFTKSPSR